MKNVQTVFLLSMAICQPRLAMAHYHRDVGIELAARIKAAEDTDDELETKIVNGEPTQIGQFPFMGGLNITLTNGQGSFCGSSLISPTRLLTAAHCWWDGQSQAAAVEVVLGSNRLYTGGTRIVTSDVQIHSEYTDFGYHNDIAIISIPQVEYNEYIWHVDLPIGNFIYESFIGYTATAVGYGQTYDNDPSVQINLNHAQLQVIHNEECSQVYVDSMLPSKMCTSTTDGRSTCGGDSGGPLVVTHGSGTILIGITSFGFQRGCQLGVPVVFTRVTSYIQWIYDRL